MEFWARDDLETNNAYHVGRICYTEDHITVYNLYVYNIAKSINEEHLRKHFSNFGKVISVSIVQRKKIKSAFRYAFVNFKEPESAAKALKTNHHIVQAKRIKVKAADSWKQPAKALQNEGGNDNKEIAPNAILNLNDDCLLHIFSFLSLSEKLKMSGLCDRFQNIFEMIFKIEKTLDLNAVGHLTLMEVRQIVTKVGHLIERISFIGQYLPHNQKRFIEFLPNFCPNLRILELQSVNNIHTDTFRRIANNLKLIKQLELINCDINDQACLYLSQLPNIEQLDLSENYELTGKHLNKFEKLQILSLNDCANIQPVYFAELCSSLHGIKELNIKRCDRLNEDSFNIIANNLLELENLTISTNYQADKLCKISELKNLKSLTIFSTQLKDDLFLHLSMKKEHVLENLKIFGGHLNDRKIKSIISITSIKDLRIPHDTGVNDEFLRGCAKSESLKYLDVSGCPLITKSGIEFLIKTSECIEVLDISSCAQFSNDLIYNIINLIKVKQRYKPYMLIVGKTNIQETILEDSIYIKVKELLKLSFKYNVTVSEFSLCDDDDDDDDNYLTDDYEGIDDVYNYSDSEDNDDDYLFAMHVDDDDHGGFFVLN